MFIFIITLAVFVFFFLNSRSPTRILVTWVEWGRTIFEKYIGNHKSIHKTQNKEKTRYYFTL